MRQDWSLLKETKGLLKQYRFRPKKRLGQHFLINSSAVEKILTTANLKKEDIVLEIGTGLGLLTEELAKRVKKVIGFEVDERLCSISQKVLADFPNVEIKREDILEVSPTDFHSLGKFKVIGNLPYYITTPIIFSLLSWGKSLMLAILTVQKEVAERLISPPGRKEYGILSIGAQFYSQVEKLADFKKESFFPAPEVDSSLIRIKMRENPPVLVKDEKNFFNLVKVSFGQRRKQLVNVLSKGLNLKKEIISHKLSLIGIDPKRRAETLSLEEFAKLSNLLQA
ncbi:MAG: ribosomal RNA small subunit methyltransferase A [Candidatus Omnitrophica bacterium]|nr:ribosomal RNA small subunit methyltransferase A [Candidatus Omnitrophota bacterium]